MKPPHPEMAVFNLENQPFLLCSIELNVAHAPVVRNEPLGCGAIVIEASPPWSFSNTPTDTIEKRYVTH
jgi:hypothetical protein